MDVWTLEFRPSVREEYPSLAWLAALVIFRTLKSSFEIVFYFQVLVKFSLYRNEL